MRPTVFRGTDECRAEHERVKFVAIVSGNDRICHGR